MELTNAQRERIQELLEAIDRIEDAAMNLKATVEEWEAEIDGCEDEEQVSWMEPLDLDADLDEAEGALMDLRDTYSPTEKTR